MDDMSDVVNSMITDSYAVTRTTPSTYDSDGRLVPGVEAVLTITASIQPASGRDLQRLPEGLRTFETRVIYTTTELFTQGPNQAPDIVAVEGFAYEVQMVEQWGNVGSYFKAIAQKTGH